MDIEKIKQIVDRDFQNYCKDCFAHWITCLWGKFDDSFTFSENKEAFFWLLERLLREEKVRFDLPISDSRQDEFWDASAEDIIKHLKKGWPAEVTKETDSALIDYFYDTDRCPTISWLGEDGEWYGS